MFILFFSTDKCKSDSESLPLSSVEVFLVGFGLFLFSLFSTGESLSLLSSDVDFIEERGSYSKKSISMVLVLTDPLEVEFVSLETVDAVL